MSTVTDLAVLVPSRGRPKNVARLIEACAKTCRADTTIHFGFDEDDPALLDNFAAIDWNASALTLPRMGLCPWTNTLAAANMDASHLASIGDDMVPITPGWDEKLIGACGPAGMAYPNDLRRADIPEAIVMSTSIVRALGWMCEPNLAHWYTDQIWADLGNLAGCLTYLPDVLVAHKHPNVPGGDPADATYSEAAVGFAADLAVYQRWRMRGMRGDVAKVRACSAT